MKLIFLDMDGVICTRWSQMNIDLSDRKYGRSSFPFDKNAVCSLNHLTESTNAYIVISSAWRTLYPFIELKEMFVNEGVKGFVIGKTTISKPLSVRGIEIQLFMSDKIYNPITHLHETVESFVILDDDIKDIMPYFPNNTIQCSMKDGLTMELTEKAISILMES